ncbi:TauD/TfdA family dioxygenase [Peribacillus butanolivorans]|uniref:TauD/TfdA family dioxygenase n=1 Tax=Peribacillus butanolivorans TaxID=421767 RepID=UPI0036705602
MLSSSEMESLKNEGWLKKNINITSKHELLNVGKFLGLPVPSRTNGNLIEELRPIEKREAHKNSLSSRYGTNNFPLHTDTAYRKVPVRYIILYAKNPGSGRRPTLLVDGFKSIDETISKKLESAIIKIKNGKYSFICNMLEVNNLGHYCLRLDQDCMIPATRESAEVLDEYIDLLAKQKQLEISWNTGDLLVIDNWRMLHGRGKAESKDDNRLLYRLNLL